MQHISFIDYICVSASLTNCMLEYVDHLHDHFLHPVVIKNAHYQLPEQPGCSITIKEQSLTEYDFERNHEK